MLQLLRIQLHGTKLKQINYLLMLLKKFISTMLCQ